jgi:hypothetical protein
MWEDGVYLGVKATTGEIIVGTMKGIWRTRSVRRKPEEDRWSVDNMSLVGGVPWRMSSNDENVDGAALQGGVVRPDGGQVMGDVDERDLRDVLRAVPPKAFATNREDYERHGYTTRCPGCKALLTGTTRQKHSDACRRRMGTEMADEEKVKTAKRRKEDFIDKALEVEETNRDKEKKREDRKRGTEGGKEDKGATIPAIMGLPGLGGIESMQAASAASGSGLSPDMRMDGAGKRSEEETGGYRR